MPLIRRLPIRVRVTLAFAGAMAIMLIVIGVVLYTRFAGDLNDTIKQGLRSRAGDISALIALTSDRGLADSSRSVLVDSGESFAQILDERGQILDASPRLRARPLLTPGELRRAMSHTVIVERKNPFESVEPAILLATPTASGRRVVVVVGAGADDRNSQLAADALVLAIGGAIALLLASLAGFGVASAALKPVEMMRRTAEQITEDAPGERLPVGSADDEIARLGTTLNTMLGRLERAVDRERSFVADASHELRTPLAILKTEIELALRAGRSPAELREALESAAVETDRLAELAEALLVLARAEGGGLALATGDVEVAGLLDGVCVRFASRARANDRRIVLDESPDATVVADPRRLEQALDNLVENALRHGEGEIHLGVGARNGRVELYVRDEGPGFPEDFIAKAFERFTRADRARGRGGSGLGLSIVQVIARAHGGEARATNDPAGGARVALDLRQADARSAGSRGSDTDDRGGRPR